MKQEQYCIACMRHLPIQEFTKWMNGDRNKARRCNSCQDCDHVKERMRKAEKERKVQPDPVNPILKQLSKTIEAKRACEIRDKLADIAEQKRIDEMHEL